MKSKQYQQIFNVLFISIFAAMMGLGIVSPIMPVFAEDLGASGIWLGIIFSGFSLSRGVFMPIVGNLSDKNGRKKYIVTGLLAYAVISLLYLVAYNVYALSMIRVVHGFASAMVIPIAMAYVGEISEEDKEGNTMGRFNIALFLGMGSGPIIGGILHDVFGLSSVFIAMSVLSFIAFLLTLFLLPDLKIAGQSDKDFSDRRHPFKKLLKDDIIKGLLIFRAIGAIGRGGIMAFLPIFAAKIDITASQIGIIISVNLFLTALLQGYFGKLADRYSKILLIILGSGISAAALLFIPLIAHNFRSLLIIDMFMGIGGAISMPSASAITVIAGKRYGMGASMGVFNTAMSVGMILAPLLSGMVMDTLGLIYIFYVAGIVSVL
ncbi:MAG TPA: MFS transporter, partial [Bacteroidetes bacterium]|nr:MFS transporter [Bacteroidota bacterium]